MIWLYFIHTSSLFRQASDRIQLNLTALKSPSQLSNFTTMSQISEEMCENGELVQPNPLGI